MLFAKHHKHMIRMSIKTATRRRWEQWHAKEGGTYAVQETAFEKRSECPIIKCTNRYKQRLGDMSKEDYLREGNYKEGTFKVEWERINDTEWDDDEVVYVVEFEYIGDSYEG